MDKHVEDRIAELEVQLAHQQRMADELSDVLTAQARIIDILSRKVEGLTQRQQSMEDEVATLSRVDKPPPHY